MWTYNQVKDTFIEYFTRHQHVHVLESSLIPNNDKSLLFTNSGMVQFKNIFLGIENPTYPRVCNAQNCIRAGGKHNDLDDVGKDSYHHTFFCMLGNWSFNYDESINNGAYFKRDAIDMAWDLLTNVYRLNQNNMYITYFGGNTELGLEPDNETKNFWLKYMPENRILPFGMKENFWEMGSSGPCGPCTEIHYDKIGNRDASIIVNRDDPTVIEIWNLVFTQYHRNQNGHISKLSKQHVDTGAGCERLTAILQNCTNYQIDIYQNIINVIQSTVNSEVYQDLYGPNDPTYVNTAYRVIADHVRTLIMALNEDIMPSNVGQGYVLRRIIRRAIRYGTKLNAANGFFTEVARNVLPLLAVEDPGLIANMEKIIGVIALEEKSFGKVMRQGLKKFNKLVRDNQTEMANLFQLYSSFGFPIDIIRQLCEENNIQFSIDEYNVLLEEHKSNS